MRLPSLVAAPLYEEIGRHAWWFAPLTLRDLGTYELWATSTFEGDRDESLTKADESVEGLILLLWLSLRHYHPDVRRTEIIDVLAQDGVMDRVTDKILSHMLGGELTFTEETTKPTQPGDTADWQWVFQGLAELYSFTCVEVSDMTIEQVVLYLTPSQGTKKTVKFNTMDEALAFIARLKGQRGQSSSNN